MTECTPSPPQSSQPQPESTLPELREEPGRLRRMVLIGLIVCACLLVDQVTKVVARAELPSLTPITLLGDTIRLQYVENAGAMLGLGSEMAPQTRFFVFIVLVAVALAGLLVFAILRRQLSHGRTIAIALILGGGISNLVDRIINDGVVRDFLNVGFGPVRTGIFNVADMVILTGLSVLLISELPSRGSKAQDEDAPSTEESEEGATHAP
ncbi:MAG: signal peptidase II [Candidatus Eisenbacteria bacterium]|nr:signal peptidase II [Candidatus Eisenbacteria bacterium]